MPTSVFLNQWKKLASWLKLLSCRAGLTRASTCSHLHPHPLNLVRALKALEAEFFSVSSAMKYNNACSNYCARMLVHITFSSVSSASQSNKRKGVHESVLVRKIRCLFNEFCKLQPPTVQHKAKGTGNEEERSMSKHSMLRHAPE